MIITTVTNNDAECGSEYMTLFDLMLTYIHLGLCHNNIFCSHWQSSHYTFEEDISERIFNCSLLTSCRPLSSISAYPVVTNSGDRFCLPDPFKRRKCRPGCSSHAPYCHGRCVYGGRACFFHPCSRSPYREDGGFSCAQLAMEAEEEICRESCSDLSSDSGSSDCQDCLVENLPDQCQNLSGADCWKCSAPVFDEWKQCSQALQNSNSTIDCIPQNLVPVCKTCVCTLICYWNPQGDICQVCLDQASFSSLFVNHNHCDQGWVYSSSSSKCYKAFTQSKIWNYAKSFCENGNGNLAQAKSNNSITSVLEAIHLQAGNGQYWMGGYEVGNIGGFIWAHGYSPVDETNWSPGFPLSLPGWKTINEIDKYVFTTSKKKIINL